MCCMYVCIYRYMCVYLPAYLHVEEGTEEAFTNS